MPRTPGRGGFACLRDHCATCAKAMGEAASNLEPFDLSMEQAGR